MKLIVDATNLLTRAYHAYPSNDTQTNGIIGFVNMMLDTIKRYQPAEIHLCFDGSYSFRKALYSAYKAQRKPKDDSLVYQLKHAYTTLKRCGVSCYRLDGFEGDDLIATLANKLEEQRTILSADKDLMCLVKEKVSMIRFTRQFSDQMIINERSVWAEYGFGPDSLPHYYALRGDIGDNIPGVKGIGPKHAKDLIRAYLTISNLYFMLKHAPLTPSLKSKLMHGEQDASLSFTLVQLAENVELPEIYSGGYTKEMFHQAVQIVRSPE